MSPTTKNQLKTKIHKAIDQESDAEILDIVYSILNKSRSSFAKEYEVLTTKEILDRDRKSMKEIKSGKTVSLSSVKKKLGLK